MTKRKTVAQLTTELADAMRIIDTQQATVSHAGERERAIQSDMRRLETHSQAEFERIKNEADKKVSLANGEANSLRDIIRKQELELARMRGYFEAVQDAKPPKMIPEEREGILPKFADSSLSEPRTTWGGRGESSTPKPWWHS